MFTLFATPVPPCYSVCILVGGELHGQERHFAPARTLLLGTLVVCAAIFALFYEAALILNAIPNSLDSLVSGLSDEEMCRWTVVRGAATEEIFAGLVNAGRGSGAKVSIQKRSWSTCNNVSECIQQVVDGSVSNEPRCAGVRTEVFVSWRMIILAEFGSQRSLCDELEVVNADGSGSFSRFNIGWQFADVNSSADGADALLPILARRRRQINAAFRRAHLNKDIQKIVEQEVGQELRCTGTQQQVHVGLLVAPIFVVLLVGLFLAVVATVAVPALHRALMDGVSTENAASEAAAAATWSAEAATAANMWRRRRQERGYAAGEGGTTDGIAGKCRARHVSLDIGAVIGHAYRDPPWLRAGPHGASLEAGDVSMGAALWTRCRRCYCQAWTI